MPTQSGLSAVAAPRDASAISEADERDHADAESSRLFMDSLPEGLGVGLVALAIISVWLSLLGVTEWVATWAATVATILVVCFLAYRRYRGEERSPVQLRRWGRRFVALASASALAWGSAAFYFLPASPDVEMMIVLGVTAVGLGGIGHMATHLPCYLGFLLASSLPFVVSLLRIGDTLHLGMGIGLLALVVAAAWFGRLMNRAIRQSIVLAWRNRRLADALEVRTREAEQANLAKSRFLTAASHDLRQPLHAIGLLLDVLREQGLDEQQARTADRLVQSSDALASLFDRLLDVSKLDAGVVVPRVQAVALDRLFSVLKTAFEPLAHEKHLQLRIRSTRAVVRSDPLLLECIVGNLLSNAIRYTRQGGILLACHRRADDIAIEVWDTGIGIAPDDQAAVFEEFFQCGNPERDRRKGLGLGLSIVERLARLLGHSVELRSVPGRGSVFRIHLPELTDPISSDSETPASFLADAHLGGACVLVVDDEAEIREATVALLLNRACKPVAFASMTAAVEAVSEWDAAPDLILSDLRLPDGRSGLDLVAWLREEFNCEVPALLLSGDARSAEARARLPARTVLLAKPAAASVIIETLVALRSLPASSARPEVVPIAC